MEYIVRLDSKRRVRVFKDQLIPDRLQQLANNPSYETFIRYYTLSVRDVARIAHYMMANERLYRSEIMERLWSLETGLYHFESEGLEIINRRFLE